MSPWVLGPMFGSFALFNRGGKSSGPAIAAETGVRVSTSMYGNPVALVWGTTRAPVNLIWYGDFVATAQTQSAGKGGGSQTTVVGYTYSAALMMGVCEGVVDYTGKAWSGKTVTTVTALGLEVFGGALTQDYWGYLTTHHPTQALRYPGIAYAASGNYALSTSASVPNVNLEVKGGYSTQNGGLDASPKDVLVDFLGDPIHGAGYPVSTILGLDFYRDYCDGQGLYISPVWASLKSASDYLKQLLLETNTEILTSQGVMKLVPYTDQPSVFAISADELLAPVRRISANNDDAFNVLKFNYRSRSIDYNASTIEAQDQVSVSTYGRREAAEVDGSDFCDDAAAMRSAQLRLQRVLYVRQRFEVKVGIQRTLYEPMDIGTVPYRGHNVAVRIVAVSRDGDEFTWTCEEYIAGIGSVSAMTASTGSGYAVDESTAPGAIYAPLLINAPAWLTQGENQVWMAVAGDNHWGGASIHVSLDGGASYSKIGTISKGCIYGTLSAALPDETADPDIVNTLSVTLADSSQSVPQASTNAAQGDASICWVDGELLSYVNSTLTGVGQYNLTTLYRGRKSTAHGAHASGTNFAKLNRAIFRYSYDSSLVGKTIKIKFTSYNEFGNAEQSLADVTTVYTLVLSPTTSGTATADYIGAFNSF